MGRREGRRGGGIEGERGGEDIHLYVGEGFLII